MADLDYSTEEWRVIPFAPDYAVSNMGRVRRETSGTGLSRARAGHILRPGACGGGRAYLHVSLCKNGKPVSHNVHRLVAVCFLPPPPSPDHVIAHNDGNGKNNAVTNLRWATQASNHADKLRHGTHDRGSRNPQSRLSEADVLQIRRSTQTENELARIYRVNPCTIGKIKRRERWAWLEDAHNSPAFISSDTL